MCWLVTDSALAVFRSRKRRLPVTPAPVRPGSCTVDLLCGGVPLPGRTISQPCRLLRSGNAPGVQYPSQFCSCPRVRSPFGVVRPPAVCRASHPDNLVGGPVAQMPHPLRCATDRGRSPRLLGFFPAGKPFPPDLAPDGSMLPWACASLRSSDTGNTGMPARLSQPADPLAMDTASGIPTLMGFAGGVDVLRRLQEPTHLPGRAALAHPPPTLQRSWLAPNRSSPGRSPVSDRSLSEVFAPSA